MMNIKNTIQFKTLRDKGVSALDIKDDEIIQVYTKDGVKCIVTQEHLFKLFADLEKYKEKSGESISKTSYSGQSLTNSFESKVGKSELLGNIMGSAQLSSTKPNVDEVLTAILTQADSKPLNQKETDVLIEFAKDFRAMYNDFLEKYHEIKEDGNEKSRLR